jgi:uncharacterized metal-binding protein
MKCAVCEEKDCYQGKDCTKIMEQARKKYVGNDLKSMEVSTGIEAEYYMKKTRLEELILYAKGMGYEKLGIAFCIGLANEAKLINQILEKDFEVCSVCCKLCGMDKKDFKLPKLRDDRYEAICNPIGQAMIMNNERTDMNIILGLCIGHDILFTKHSKAPVTTLAVKDRVLSHNPLGAIYTKYYQKNVFGL